jgi:ubiquinone/menaquinone biosynthesis C-methylase UbiE
MNLAQVAAVPLADLGLQDARYRGIFAPRKALGNAKVGVTSQFLDRAEEYHRNYLHLDYWSHLLGRALSTTGGMSDPNTIIDIGSGSGNSVIPLAERFPKANIIATDISPDLLAILRDFLDRDQADVSRFGLLCADASAMEYRMGVADLVVGAAILHHILDPSLVLNSCFQALRPGGWAIFFEPFEAGNHMLMLVYQRILAEASTDERNSPAFRFFQKMVADYRIRQRPKTDPVFLGLDDKWLFTKNYFERLKEDQVWEDLIVFPLSSMETPMRDQATIQLKLSAGLAPTALPDWAWQIIDEADVGPSPDLKEEFLLEGAVLLRKGGSHLWASSGRSEITEVSVDKSRAWDGWWWCPEESGIGYFVSSWNGTVSLTVLAYDDAGEPEAYFARCPSSAWPSMHLAKLGTGIEDKTVTPGPMNAVSVSASGNSLELQVGDGRRSLVRFMEKSNASAVFMLEESGTRLLFEKSGAHAYAAVLDVHESGRIGWLAATLTRGPGGMYFGDWIGFQGGSPPQKTFHSPSKSGERMAARIGMLGERHCVALIGARALLFRLP